MFIVRGFETADDAASYVWEIHDTLAAAFMSAVLLPVATIYPADVSPREAPPLWSSAASAPVLH